MNEKKYKRIFTVVIDSLGAGEMPDAASMVMQGQIPWDILRQM